MFRSALERLSGWWTTKASPWLYNTVYPRGRACAAEWWEEIGAHPRAHFISMVVGMALLGIVRLLVRLAA